jgi:hypothetical protein
MTPTASADSIPSGPEFTAEATISPQFAYQFALGLFGVALVAIAVPYVLLWGWLGTFVESKVWFGLAVVVSLPIHEGLHGLGFHLGGAARTDVRYGIAWSTLTPYAHCQVPLSARAYRLAGALPGVVLGLIPALVGVAFEWGAWALFGLVMIGFAGGDAAMLWAIRHVPGETRVLDHPTAVGCRLLAQEGQGPHRER